MATARAFVDYVVDQASDAGAISARYMFGEYALYCNGKVVALLCDDQVFLKPTVAATQWVGTVREGFPYPGAGPWLLDDRVVFASLIRMTADALPTPRGVPERKPKTQ